MNGEQTINFNAAECLNTKVFLGFDRVTNVCSGKIVDVPWGILDWLGFGMLTIVALIFLLFVAFVIALIVSR